MKIWGKWEILRASSNLPISWSPLWNLRWPKFPGMIWDPKASAGKLRRSWQHHAGPLPIVRSLKDTCGKLDVLLKMSMKLYETEDKGSYADFFISRPLFCVDVSWFIWFSDVHTCWIPKLAVGPFQLWRDTLRYSNIATEDLYTT